MSEPFLSIERYALVTGANKGIGFDICKQLASKGIFVILTARDEKRGIEAQESLMEFDNVIFHQLDVVDPSSIASLVDFIKINYGKLDILVNNAGVSGIRVEGDVFVLHEIIMGIIASVSDGGGENFLKFHDNGFKNQNEEDEIAFLVQDLRRKTTDKLPQRVEPTANGTVIETFKGAKDCLQTNYLGVKRITEALIPLLHLSDSPRIVNISSGASNLKLLSNEWAKRVLSNEESLTEEKIDKVVRTFLKNFKEGSLEANRWPTQLAAYKVSKAALNAYTRVIAWKYPSFRVNCVCPGYTRTDITYGQGMLSAEEAAEGPVNLALLPNGGPSGLFFKQNSVSPF